MVEGIRSFVEHFKEYSDCYTVIGGTACDILLRDAGLSFRATKDIDMILILENRYQEFGKTLWAYIREGHYTAYQKQDGGVRFYRFDTKMPGYPMRIELFSRNADFQLEEDQHIIPYPLDEDTSSLSAILLDDDYYAFMMQGRKSIDGLPVLSEEYLIPFKMYAWLNLRSEKLAGRHVNERDFKKHKNDVFRLLQIISPETRVSLIGRIPADVESFIDLMEAEPIDFEKIGVPLDKATALQLLRNIYL